MTSRGFALCLAFGLGGCAHSSVVLLPDEDGGHGKVAILESGGKPTDAIVGEANSRASLGGTPTIKPVGQLKPGEAALVGDLPPPARSFTLYFLEGTTDMTPESAPKSPSGPAPKSRSPAIPTRLAAPPTMTRCLKSAPKRSSISSLAKASTARSCPPLAAANASSRCRPPTMSKVH
jgi:hypothetical protein